MFFLLTVNLQKNVYERLPGKKFSLPNHSDIYGPCDANLLQIAQSAMIKSENN